MKTYNPKKVSVSFKGRPVSGFAKDTFITVTRNADSFGVEVGADGEGARVASQDFSGQVELTLMQTSRSNDDLSNALATDELTNTGTGAMLIKDASGRTVLEIPEAWIKKPADAEFGSALGNRKWVFESALIKMFHGGN